MPETHNNILEPNSIFQKIWTSDAFAKAHNEVESQDLSREDRARRSVRMAANILKDAKPSGRMTLDGHAMNITAQLTTFSQSIEKLHALREQGARHSEKMPELVHIAEFNHAVKEMIDANPSLSFNEVFKFIMSMNQRINGRTERNKTDAFGEEVRGVLDGMRHEIAFELMLGYMPDVEYRESTPEEDLKGADIFISMDGSPMIPLDIKASWNNAQRSKNEAHGYGFDSSHIIWSHLTDEDFNGTFRIPYETAEARAVAVHDDIANIVYEQFRPVAVRR